MSQFSKNLLTIEACAAHCSPVGNFRFPFSKFLFPKRVKRRAAFSFRAALQFLFFSLLTSHQLFDFCSRRSPPIRPAVGPSWFWIEQPIAQPDRETPPPPHSRRHAMGGSTPLEPTNETLPCATRTSVVRLFPIVACSQHALRARSRFP